MRRLQDKEVLTTGEVAQICHVAPRTVSKWFDVGKLRGYRIPGSRDRRIPRRQLLAFMRAHGLPLDAIEGGILRVLVVGGHGAAAMAEAIAAHEGIEARPAANGFEAGVEAQRFGPHVIVLNLECRLDEQVSIARNVRACEALSDVKVLAMLDASTRTGTKDDAFDIVLPWPCPVEELVSVIEQVAQSG